MQLYVTQAMDVTLSSAPVKNVSPPSLRCGSLSTPTSYASSRRSTWRATGAPGRRRGSLLLESVFLGEQGRLESSHPKAQVSSSLSTRVGGMPGAATALLDLSAPAAAKWVLRMVSFYGLVRLGVAKEVEGGAIDNAQSYLTRQLFGDPEAKKEKEARKAAVKWKESTKGTLVRKLRVPSVSQGRKMLNSVAGVLAEDDLFVDVASHKGCQVRRETAHSESVCCYNVRALFDELPTPHIEVEITVFPPGPLTALEYQKAQKLESVLRRGHSI